MIAYIKLKTPDTACSGLDFGPMASMSRVFELNPNCRLNPSGEKEWFSSMASISGGL